MLGKFPGVIGKRLTDVIQVNKLITGVLGKFPGVLGKPLAVVIVK